MQPTVKLDNVVAETVPVVWICPAPASKEPPAMMPVAVRPPQDTSPVVATPPGLRVPCIAKSSSTSISSKNPVRSPEILRDMCVFALGK